MTLATEYNATIFPPGQVTLPASPAYVWKTTYQTQLIDGSVLEIPFEPLPSGNEAIALLMSNQCTFGVIDQITSLMAQVASEYKPDCIAAVPTMGLEYATHVARKLGHENYVAMGFSQKFWYADYFFEPIRSTTSPNQIKKLYLDPHLVARVKNKRVVIIDDVINTGASTLATAKLLRRLGATVTAIVVGLTEGHAWAKAQKADDQAEGCPIKGIGHIPVFSKVPNGWAAIAETC